MKREDHIFATVGKGAEQSSPVVQLARLPYDNTHNQYGRRHNLNFNYRDQAAWSGLIPCPGGDQCTVAASGSWPGK